MQNSAVMNPRLICTIYFGLSVSASIFFNKPLIKIISSIAATAFALVTPCNNWTYRNSIPAEAGPISNQIIQPYRGQILTAPDLKSPEKASPDFVLAESSEYS
jgi:hypothetical protein